MNEGLERRASASPTISVIIPVYNAEKYLRRCIDSVLSQTFTDFELLLIDDGSKDKSGAICDEYAAKDSRVRVFHKKNGGVSSARNLGIDNANGKWVIFIDADDYWIENTALTYLYEFARANDLDIARGEYISVDANEREIDTQDYTKKRAFEHKLLSRRIFLESVVCGEFFLVLCLIKRDAIVGLHFDENQFFLEDMKFYMEMLSKKQNCGYIQHYFYAYRKTVDSASRTFKMRDLKDAFGMCDFWWNKAETTDDGDLSSLCRHYAVMMYYLTLQKLANFVSLTDFRKVSHILNLTELHKQTCLRSNCTDVKLSLKVRIILIIGPKYGMYLLRIRALIAHYIRQCKNI